MNPRPGALSARGPVFAGALALFALPAVLVAWGSGADIATGLVLQGQVVATQKRGIVQHPEGGRVIALHVSEGDPVRAGDRLLSLDPGPLASERAMVEARLFALGARRARLTAEARGLPALSPVAELAARARSDPEIAAALADQSKLLRERQRQSAQDAARQARRRAQIAARLDGLAAQEQALAAERMLLRQEQARQDPLAARGLVPEATLLALAREAARLDGRIGETRALVAQAHEAIVEIEIAMAAAVTTRRETALQELRAQAPEEAELFERRLALDARIDALDLAAPVGGTVHGLSVPGPGAVVRPAEPVLWIVPADSPLAVEIRIPPHLIGKLSAGQAARLRLMASSQRDAPEIGGTLQRVSADVFTDKDGTAFYQGEVAVSAGATARPPDGVRLLPGMPVEVRIVTGSRRPLEALAGPLWAYFARAFGDG